MYDDNDVLNRRDVKVRTENRWRFITDIDVYSNRTNVFDYLIQLQPKSKF